MALATITISLRDILGEGFACPVIFTPVETPYVDGATLIATREKSVTTDENGEGEITLKAGQYKVSFPRVNVDILTIGVPDEDVTYSLTALINAGSNLPVPPVTIGPVGPTGPRGEAATIEIGDVETLAPGEPATVSNSGDEYDAVLNFGIPKGETGDKGETGTMEVGTVTTGDPGSSASISNSGTPEHGVFNFTLPRGDKGDKGDPSEPVHAELTGTEIDFSRDGCYWAAISANRAYTFSSPANAHVVVLKLTTSSGAQPSWPVGVQWLYAPDPIHPLNGTAIYTFIRINGVITGAMAI